MKTIDPSTNRALARPFQSHQWSAESRQVNTPYVIRKILSKSSEAETFQKYMGEFGRESGLFEAISIKRHGRGETAPFELDVVLNFKALGINNVGYGVSQSLPIVVELFSQPRKTRFAIQQPEVHLHPKAQAALGDLFFRLAISEQKSFCIETHSDYLIDRFRLNYRKMKAHPSAQVLFFERGAAGNLVHALEIDEDGHLSANQPPGYRKFFVNEALAILDID